MIDTALHNAENLLDQQILNRDNYRLLISGARNQTKQMIDDLGYFTTFLRYANTKRKEFEDDDTSWHELVREIGEAVLDADDLVDEFITRKMMDESKNWLGRFFSRKVKLDGIAKELRSIRERAVEVYGDRERLLELLG